MEKPTEKINGYQVAVEMYKREHERWHQWALFFLGLIAGVFVIWGQICHVIPLWVASAVAAVLSLMWTVAACALRATTGGWESTIKKLECENKGLSDGAAFSLFRDEVLSGGLVSVTRMLMFSGVLSTLAFLALTVALLCGCLTAPPGCPPKS